MKNKGNQFVVGSSEPNPDLLGIALAAVWQWGLENNLVDVDAAEVVEIVSRYEGDAEPTPFEVVEPVPFVERRKISVS